MATELKRLSRRELKRLKCPVDCMLLDYKIENLSDYLAVMSSVLSDEKQFWFRGHRDVRWALTPSALRFKSFAKREAALGLLPDFRRIAEIKLERPPLASENLKWAQLAQHYGIPTRLLDWTESALFGLYFACIPPRRGQQETDGIVFLLNPEHLSHLPDRPGQTSLDIRKDERLINEYFEMGGKRDKKGIPTIAIKPVWNSERLMMQRGVFTLHGSQYFNLDDTQAPSLVGVPIERVTKGDLRKELDGVGIDEITLFPELEHACMNLKRRTMLN